jgi:hypothetical protein
VTLLIQRQDAAGYVTFLNSDDDNFYELSEVECPPTEFTAEQAQAILATTNPWTQADRAKGFTFAAVDAETTFQEAGLI